MDAIAMGNVLETFGTLVSDLGILNALCRSSNFSFSLGQKDSLCNCLNVTSSKFELDFLEKRMTTINKLK